jgi:hypothetical protein
MNQVQRVVICGPSVFLMSIEASLARLPGMEVLRLNCRLPDAEARIMALAPDAVIVERNGDHADQARAMLRQGLLLVELDASQDVVTILSSHQVRVSGAEDLAQVIEQIGASGPGEDIGQLPGRGDL